MSVQPAHARAIQLRLQALLSAMRAPSGVPPRLLLVPEGFEHPGNLVGTLLAWNGALARAKADGWDLLQAWRAGARVAIVHAAGKGRRAAPLVHAEDGDRSSLFLPGTLAGAPARLLEAVLCQIAPLAVSQPAGFLDVIWASQLFLPGLSPSAVPPPTAPLTKLGTAHTDPSAKADVGVFLMQGDAPARFVPQGQPMPGSDELRAVADLGSFRLRADLLDVLCRRYLDPLPRGPRDLDPHLTGPLLGAGGPTLAEAEAVRADMGEHDLVGVTDLQTDHRWWRLRRPAELRACAMATRPSSPEDGLRTLLGIEHPITRTWFSDTWIEGPELDWETVRSGVDIGDIYVEDCIIQDSALWAWKLGGRAAVHEPTVRTSVIQSSTGGLDLEDAWFVGSGGAGWRGGGGLAWRVIGEPPPAAGPSPTAEGICGVRRPRLRDGEAVYHGFLHEDAKSNEARERDVGPTWRELSRLPTFVGPRLEDPVAPDLDKHAPHLIVSPPLLAIALLRERLPPRTDLLRLLELVEDGRFVIALHRGCRPAHGVDADLIPGRRFRPTELAYRLHGDLESWQRWTWSPARVAESLFRCLVQHFIPSGSMGRDAWTERRVEAFRAGIVEARPALQAFLEQRVLDRDAGSVLERVSRWSLARDPDRTDLAAMFDALDVLSPAANALRDVSHLRAWCRWQLERGGQPAGVVTERLAGAPRHLLGQAGFVWQHPWVDHGQPVWIPRIELRPRRVPDAQLSSSELVKRLAMDLRSRVEAGSTPVLGVCGPAASGKSSLAVTVAEALDAHGLRVAFLTADQFCWQGDSFRYDQLEHTRNPRLYGPGIVDELGLIYAVDQARHTHDCVIVEGVYVGRDPGLRARLDLLVAVLLEDRIRLDMKFARDALGGKRRIDVITDFADKVHHESLDGVAPILPHADRIWDRGTGELWSRPPSG